VSRIRTSVVVRSVVAGITLVAVGGGVRLVLARQAALARRRIGKPLGEESLDADRVWRRALDGEPLDLLVLGDSIAAGLGAEHRKETLGGRLAKATGRRIHRPVRLRTAAVVGAESPDLQRQLDAVPTEYRPDVAVIVVGGNDVTHRLPVALSAQHLHETIRRLRERGAEPVDLRRAVGPMFFDEPEAMFSLDRFHPSALGYRRTAEALLPAVFRAAERSLSSRRLPAQR
jgi:lysophospholipase L1-like esterase